jgi:putative transposase
MMQSIGRRYVRYVNAIYRRSGTLWEGRFKSAVVDTDRYLLTCMRYIELNPVRAGMVDSPDEYRWSSFNVNAHGAASELITSHFLYDALGGSDSERQNVYLGLFQACIEPDILDQIRQATQGGDVIGNQRFREQIATALARKVERFTHGGDRKSESFRNR